MLISNWFKTAKYLNTKLYKLHLNLHMVSRQRKNKQKGLSLVLNTKKRHIKNKKKKKKIVIATKVMKAMMSLSNKFSSF